MVNRGAERPTGPINPFESFILGVCILQGLVVLSGTASPTSIDQALSPTLRTVWAVLLFLGGTLSFSGLHWPWNPFTGVEIKRVGLVAAGTAALTYGVAQILAGPAGYVAALLNLAFVAACAVRIVQVTRRIRETRRRIVDAQDPGD